MTAPDEALKYARERAKRRFSVLSTAGRNICAEIDAGKYDDELSEEADAYRAGQAASAERIKALEGLVQNLMLEARARTMRSNTPLTTNIVEMTVPDRVALLKEADQ